MVEISISTKKHNEFVDISTQIRNVIDDNNWENGVLFLNTLHTTAGLTINENADPDVKSDIITALEELIPKLNFKHFEGNSDAHIKSSLMGTALTIPVIRGQLVLGTWQGIYFCEFDGPRSRKIHLSFLKGE